MKHPTFSNRRPNLAAQALAQLSHERARAQIVAAPFTLLLLGLLSMSIGTALGLSIW